MPERMKYRRNENRVIMELFNAGRKNHSRWGGNTWEERDYFVGGEEMLQKLTYRYKFEARHPRCVGSITNNFFVYYTYGRTQLYFS